MVDAECAEAGCRGVPVDHGRCLGHVDEQTFERKLPVLSLGGPAVELRGATISAVRVGRLLSKLTSGGEIRRHVRLSGATIDGDVRLSDVVLRGDLELDGATIDGSVDLSRVSGLSHLRLGDFASQPTTMKSLWIGECRGDDEDLRIENVQVGSGLRLHRASLRSLQIMACDVAADLEVVEAVIARDVRILGCSGRQVSADRVQVAGSVTAALTGAAELTSCRFGSWVDIGCTGGLSADRVICDEPFRLDWQGRFAGAQADAKLSLRSVRFGSSAHIRWAAAEIDLAGSVFTAASTLTASEHASGPPVLACVDDMDGERLRMDRIDVSNVRLSRAASLGPIDPWGLRGGLGRVGLTRRHFMADEMPPRLLARWDSAERKTTAGLAPTLSAAYRQLRKRAEDVGNYTGANDLYLGERLWARKAARLGSVQWLWLAAHGLVGYGVRPLRPLLALVVAIAMGVLVLGATSGLERQRTLSGAPSESRSAICARDRSPATPADAVRVTCPADFGDRLEFAVRTTTSLVRPVEGFELTHGGVVVEIGLRLLAALFFGLFLLSIRNRVRR